MSTLDSARPVRAGEQLDAGRLADYLGAHLAGFAGPLTVAQFPSGFSNLTYLLSAGGHEWVLRRPPFGTRPRTGHDMAREYRVLAALHERFPYSPQALHYCAVESVIGAPFYVMRRLRGIILRREYPQGLEPAPELVRAQQESVADVLARLHAVDYAAAGLADLGKPQGYVARQVQGWTERFARSATPDGPDAARVTTWLAAHQPAESARVALLHNDFKLDNVVFDPDQPARVIGVLDWEMATLGDPLMDLGCSLAYWIGGDDPDWLRPARMVPTHLPGSLSRREFVDRYAAAAGTAIGDVRYHYVFGLFRLAVIAQQIYYRYHLGQTQDKRFAALGPMVHAMVRAAGEAARGGLL